jgi:hypothetical protein
MLSLSHTVFREAERRQAARAAPHSFALGRDRLVVLPVGEARAHVHADDGVVPIKLAEHRHHATPQPRPWAQQTVRGAWLRPHVVQRRRVSAVRACEGVEGRTRRRLQKGLPGELELHPARRIELAHTPHQQAPLLLGVRAVRVPRFTDEVVLHACECFVSTSQFDEGPVGKVEALRARHRRGSSGVPLPLGFCGHKVVAQIEALFSLRHSECVIRQPQECGVAHALSDSQKGDPATDAVAEPIPWKAGIDDEHTFQCAV